MHLYTQISGILEETLIEGSPEIEYSVCLDRVTYLPDHYSLRAKLSRIQCSHGKCFNIINESLDYKVESV